MANEDLLAPLTPELKVRDIGQSLMFYTQQLGFTLCFDRPDEGFAAIQLGGAYLMLEQIEELDPDNLRWTTAKLEYPLGRGVNFQVTVTNAEEIHDRLQAGHYPIKLPLEEVSYRVNSQLVHVRQFMIMDPDGYLIRLSTIIGMSSLREPLKARSAL